MVLMMSRRSASAAACVRSLNTATMAGCVLALPMQRYAMMAFETGLQLHPDMREYASPGPWPCAFMGAHCMRGAVHPPVPWAVHPRLRHKRQQVLVEGGVLLDGRAAVAYGRGGG
jgi:hypothetical protein